MMRDNPEFKNYVGGKWVKAAGDRTFVDSNPADRDDVIGVFPESAEGDISDAVEAAKQAFPGWRLTPPPHRAEIIYRAADLLTERKEDLARIMTREMGKVMAEALGDVQEAVDMALHAAGEGRRLFGQTTPSELRNKFPCR